MLPFIIIIMFDLNTTLTMIAIPCYYTRGYVYATMPHAYSQDVVVGGELENASCCCVNFFHFVEGE